MNEPILFTRKIDVFNEKIGKINEKIYIEAHMNSVEKIGKQIKI